MNVVLIFTDQQHKYALGKVSPWISTPNLDRLCEQGVRFSNAYSNAPICGPFRGTLFSGTYISECGTLHNGDPLPSHLPCMAETFTQAGYETGFVGKWHLGGNGQGPIPENLRGGFKHFIGYQCYNGFRENVCFYDEDGQPCPSKRHRTDYTADLAIAQLSRLHESGKPFLQTTWFQAPHYPEQPSPEFEQMYLDRNIPRPPAYQEIDPYTPTGSPRSPSPVENCPDYQRYGNNIDTYLKLYCAMVTQIDANVGRILDHLEGLGCREETMILFSSDHGDMQGCLGLKNKCLPHEMSCGIPMIITTPGGITNCVCEQPVSGIDVYPTILDYCGLDHPAHLKGHSWLSGLKGGEFPNKPVFAEQRVGSRQWCMVRDGAFKLTVKAGTGEPDLLFDLAHDPHEEQNLVSNTEFNQHLQSLLVQLHQTFPNW